jgi:hypothetical protein
MEKCNFCGAYTEVRLDGMPICEQCAVDRESARRKYEERADTFRGTHTTPQLNGSGKLARRRESDGNVE